MPVVLLTGYNVVKSQKFSTFRTLGNPITVSRIYDARGVDEMILLDIRATSEGRGPRLDIISDIAGECFMPLTVGGGIHRLDQALEVIRKGADKVAVNTAAIERPELLKELSQELGVQAVVASIDVRKESDGCYLVMSHSGKKETTLVLLDWVKKLEQMGAGEILINSIDRDGEMKGYDLELIKMVSEAVSVPVIACGGAGSPQDCLLALQEGGANAVAAASMFHFTGTTPLMVKEHLSRNGIAVRLA